MDDIFDISKFNEYREDNRLEVKAAEGGRVGHWVAY